MRVGHIELITQNNNSISHAFHAQQTHSRTALCHFPNALVLCDNNAFIYTHISFYSAACAQHNRVQTVHCENNLCACQIKTNNHN
jgi:hypothetical protein